MSRQSAGHNNLSNGNNVITGTTPTSSRSGNSTHYAHIKDLQHKAQAALKDYGPYTPMGKLLDHADGAAKRVSTDVSFKRPDRAYVEHLISQEIVVNLIPRNKDYVTLNADRPDWKRRHAALCRANDAQTPMIKQIADMIAEDNATTGVLPSGGATQSSDHTVMRQSLEAQRSPRPLSMPSTPTTYEPRGEELFLSTNTNNASSSREVPARSTSAVRQPSPLRREKPAVQPKPSKLRAHALQPLKIAPKDHISDDQVAQRFARLRVQQMTDGREENNEGTRKGPSSSPTALSAPNSSPTAPKALTDSTHQESGGELSPAKPKGPRSMPDSSRTPAIPPKIPLSPHVEEPFHRSSQPIHSALDRTESGGTVKESQELPYHQQASIAKPGERSPRSPKRSSAPQSLLNGVYPPSRSSSMQPPRTTISATDLQSLFQRARVLLIDVRSRDQFDNGHMNVKSIICIEPVGIRAGMSAADLEDRLVNSPASELAVFEQMDKYDFIVYYDQSTSNDRFLKGAPTRTEANHLRAIHDTLFDFNDSRPLKARPLVLLGGLDAWSDLTGPQALVTSDTSGTESSTKVRRSAAISRKHIGRLSSVSANSSLEVRKRRLREQRHLNPDEERTWLQKAQNEVVEPSTYSKQHSDSEYDVEGDSVEHSPAFVRSYEEFLRKFPEPSQVSQPSSSTLGPRKDAPSVPPPPPPNSVPVIPSRPPPTLPRPSYGGVSDSKSSQYPSISRQASAKQQPIYFSRTSSKYRKLPRTGLQNFGVTCYMNATIQCLLATIPLSSFFLGEEWRKYVRKNWKGSNGILPEYFANLIRNLWADDARVVRPSSLRSFCARLKDEWGMDRQQDAKEFFDFIVDCLHEDLNVHFEEKPPPPLTEREELMHEDWPVQKAAQWEWSRYLARETSFISDLFAGQHASRLKCTTCKRTSTTYEPFYSISVEIPPSSFRQNNWGIHSCLRSYCREEDLSGDEVWKCPYCKQEREATKQITITRAPQFLVIHFKRFEIKRGNAKKVHTAIDFPLYGLDMGDYMVQDNARKGFEEPADHSTSPPFMYDCYAVMRHIGRTGNGGHYISLIRDSVRGCWRKFDDDRVSDFDPAKWKGNKSLQNEEAYLLFYSRALPR